MIQQIDESHYIAVLVTKTKIQMNCTNTDLQLISGNYLITVPFQCQFSTEDQTFSNNRLISESQPLLLPNIVIPHTHTHQEEIPEVHIQDVQLDKIHLIKKKQEEIKTLILKNSKITHPNFWNLIVIFLIIIILAYFVIKFIKRRTKSQRKDDIMFMENVHIQEDDPEENLPEAQPRSFFNSMKNSRN
uniref:Uncharacterized protein LOC114340292 isoform X1 n=1 Tax=Diabrotica virgifera virgifera TaxID=50390 RepID=A0A6P7GC07_DIAVI